MRPQRGQARTLGPICPNCHTHSSTVRNVWYRDDGAGEVKRRRRCTTCGHLFTTYEVSSENHTYLRENW